MAEEPTLEDPNQHEAHAHSARVVYSTMDSVMKKAEFVLDVPNFDEYVRAGTHGVGYSNDGLSISSDFNADGVMGNIALREGPSVCYVEYAVSLSTDDVAFSVFDISLKAYLCKDHAQIEVHSNRSLARRDQTLNVRGLTGMSYENIANPKPELPSTKTNTILRIVLNVKVSVSKQPKAHPIVGTCDLGKERDPPFLKAFQDGCDSDVQLVYVSRVFRRMLEAPMKEAATRKIEIEDLSLDSVQRMVDYIYHGRFNFGSNAQVIQLLYAADKYEIELLKSACFERMVTTMSDENITDFLDNSIRVNAEAEVIKQMVDYCMDRMGELRKRKDFQAFARENSKLFLEILLSPY